MNQVKFSDVKENETYVVCHTNDVGEQFMDRMKVTGIYFNSRRIVVAETLDKYHREYAIWESAGFAFFTA